MTKRLNTDSGEDKFFGKKKYENTTAHIKDVR
jgi:hypothetical protein